MYICIYIYICIYSECIYIYTFTIHTYMNAYIILNAYLCYTNSRIPVPRRSSL